MPHLGITLWGFGIGYREAVDLARRAEDAGFHNLTAARYRRAVERFRRAAREAGRDPATAMAALSDALLDDVVLLGPPSRIREGIDRSARAGAEWITMGPQAAIFTLRP